ncbi:MAG: DNA topoisomerase IV subunit A [Alphaproteobacteria bacterium]|nr:DNA topoisomerase IV subunit A [Alphaproteobacteria bacterium]
MTIKINNAGTINTTLLDQALGERYLNYAMSTITSRSLPDVRDGLKPVHRRILYAMWESGNMPTRPYRKSASAVGYVMMRYHPHGDGAIYDSLVRMAQDFAMRYPLVDGQGNFGSIDGDNAAAMRYTEARLTQIAESLLSELNENAVDFLPSYNGSDKEPVVLPARFPNLLANGASGIAVGMATNIPPHNVSELCDGLRQLIKNPQTPLATLLKLIPGPDFPTGGIIVETAQSLLKTYDTGRGSIRLRARWKVETLKSGQYQIVVTELPYQIQKARLIEKIADLLNNKKLPLLADIADESAADIRIILHPKSRNIDPKVLMESLFRQTDLEVKFNLNLNVLNAEGIPGILNLGQALTAFLAHRHQVLCRRTQHRLDHIAQRLEILGGYLVAYLNLDEVIRIVRYEDDPRTSLIAQFKLTEVQADAILNMRLKALRKLEEFEIRSEFDALTVEQLDLKDLLADEKRLWQKIDQEIIDIKKQFGTQHEFGKRRTTFEESPIALIIPREAEIEREPVTVICSSKGWIRTIKGHNLDPLEIKYKEGDEARFIIQAETIDKLLIFASNGKFYTLAIDKLPRGRGFGDPIRLMVDLGHEDDIITLLIHQPDTVGAGRHLLLAASDGYGFLVKEKDVIAQTRTGKQVLNLSPGAKAKCCISVQGDGIAVIGENRKLLIFKQEELPLMSRGRGVRLQYYRDGGLSDLKSFELSTGLTWPMGIRTRAETDLAPWLARRGHSGRLPPVGFPRSNKFDGS